MDINNRAAPWRGVDLNFHGRRDKSWVKGCERLLTKNANKDTLRETVHSNNGGLFDGVEI